MWETDTKSTTRNHRTICVPFSQDAYNDIVQNPDKFRNCLDEKIKLFPELFPADIFQEGYLMKDIYHSKKMSIPIRRIEMAGIAYTVRPSFVTPYLTGLVDEVEKVVLLT
ncbi:hypothetical protein [uncultured Desulfobacter sp.]|uniref:hypothetical protein n=1 Tax=uncultured Desulfobacter sp. TaxID=240139 RepID=UPI0029F5AF08|nr:hypothetical protein [uncultured Desulfobacter sp.]